MPGSAVLTRPCWPGLKRGLNVIEDALRQVAGTSAEGLSRADMIALAAAEAVRMTGGPSIRVPIGGPVMSE